MQEKLKTLNERGWSHDQLAWLVEVSRPTIRKIINGDGEDTLGELQTTVLEAVFNSGLTHKEFIEYAKSSYRLELVRRDLCR